MKAKLREWHYNRRAENLFRRGMPVEKLWIIFWAVVVFVLAILET